MNILKEVLKHQVYPAMGCTEPVSVALCAAHCAKFLGEPVEHAVFSLDAGTYKNGIAIHLPNTDGEKGNLLAGAIGLILKKPELKMEIFKMAKPEIVSSAKKLIKEGRIKMYSLSGKEGIYIRAELKGKKNTAVCVIEKNHSEVSFLKVNSNIIVDSKQKSEHKKIPDFKKKVAKLTLTKLADIAAKADKEDLAFIKKGVEMNLKAAREGMKLKKVGYYLMDLKKRKYIADDVFTKTKIAVGCAADARMNGAPLPVMTSGESGNQGIVSALAPCIVGRCFGANDKKIYESIAFAHLVNCYVKIYTGALSPICGCAIGAGVGAAAAIVYQLKGNDEKAIGLAVNNLISDIGGMLCDGAKSGCALKVVSSVDCAIRSAYMGIRHYGITDIEGFVGKTAEETIKNLAKISTTGMGKVDDTILRIMQKKQNAPSCRI